MTSSQARPLTREEVAAFGAELDELRSRIVADLGENDARYVRRIRDAVRWSELGGRALLFAGILPPAWALGTLLLGLSKILENMELGHNVMHGQYDWMQDPEFHSQTYDWDNACAATAWRHSHNYLHHLLRPLHRARGNLSGVGVGERDPRRVVSAPAESVEQSGRRPTVSHPERQPEPPDRAPPLSGRARESVRGDGGGGEAHRPRVWPALQHRLVRAAARGGDEAYRPLRAAERRTGPSRRRHLGRARGTVAPRRSVVGIGVLRRRRGSRGRRSSSRTGGSRRGGGRASRARRSRASRRRSGGESAHASCRPPLTRTLLSLFSIRGNPSSRVDTQARAIFVRLHTARP